MRAARYILTALPCLATRSRTTRRSGALGARSAWRSHQSDCNRAATAALTTLSAGVSTACCSIARAKTTGSFPDSVTNRPRGASTAHLRRPLCTETDRDGRRPAGQRRCGLSGNLARLEFPSANSIGLQSRERIAHPAREIQQTASEISEVSGPSQGLWQRSARWPPRLQSVSAMSACAVGWFGLFAEPGRWPTPRLLLAPPIFRRQFSRAKSSSLPKPPAPPLPRVGP